MNRTPLLLVLALYGCGGPSAPSVIVPPAPIPVTVEVRDGWTGAPVAVSVPPALPGSTVSVSTPGYLPRVQIFNGPVYLWPQDETFVRQLVYGETFGGLLTRWIRGFSISAPGYEDIASQVAAEVMRTTGLAVTVGGTAGNLVASVNESDPYWNTHPDTVAYSTVDLQGHTIVSGRIIFRTRSWVRLSVFLHETGHAIGLSHIDGPDVMSPSVNGAKAFSERETIALRMMYERRAAANAPPDREGITSSSERRTVVFVD